MKIKNEIKELAKEIHKAEHLFVNGKIDQKHKLEEYYYLLGSLAITNITKEINKSHIELYNFILELQNKINSFELSIKEMSKQQKYLWQTLEDKSGEKE